MAPRPNSTRAHRRGALSHRRGGQNKARSEQETVAGFKPQKPRFSAVFERISGFSARQRDGSANPLIWGRLELDPGRTRIWVDGEREFLQHGHGQIVAQIRDFLPSVLVGPASTSISFDSLLGRLGDRIRSRVNLRSICDRTGSSVTTQFWTMSATRSTSNAKRVGEILRRSIFAANASTRSTSAHSAMRAVLLLRRHARPHRPPARGGRVHRVG